MQISIKPFCDQPICLTASADEWLSCLKQTSFDSTISFMDPPFATVAQNRIIADSLLTYTTGPLTFLFHPISHTTTTTSFFLYSSSNLWLPWSITFIVTGMPSCSLVSFPTILFVLGRRGCPRGTTGCTPPISFVFRVK